MARYTCFMAKVEYWDQRPTKEWRVALSNVLRFEKLEMIHRTDLYVHARRVQGLSVSIGQACRQLGYPIDMSTVERRSLHHDDPEVETTDIPSPEKRAMTPDQKALLRQQEMEA